MNKATLVTHPSINTCKVTDVSPTARVSVIASGPVIKAIGCVAYRFVVLKWPSATMPYSVHRQGYLEYNEVTGEVDSAYYFSGYYFDSLKSALTKFTSVISDESNLTISQEAGGMTLGQIKDAVNRGEKVFWKQSNYVVKSLGGDYEIVCTSNGTCIGLTHRGGVTLNGETTDFYIER